MGWLTVTKGEMAQKGSLEAVLSILIALEALLLQRLIFGVNPALLNGSQKE